jgi:hypothetical protein
VRLTLRTLLAYLDDTLEPAQAKLIGQKVAESDTARELIARIKQVTRRRRLTAPPTLGGKVDANIIAGYLDNALSAEQLAEVEQMCLASDMHLAEMAACHQILSLVLGEPALVPPTAKQRMYALVKGPEAIPFRKPAAATSEAEAVVYESRETDETLRLGLPALRARGGWTNRLILLGGGVAVAALLVIAITQVLQFERGPFHDRPRGTPTQLAKLDGDKKRTAAETKREKETKKVPTAKAKETAKTVPDNNETTDPNGKKPPVQPTVPTEPVEVAAAPPSMVRAVAGHYERNATPDPGVLLQYDRDKSQWQRLDLKKSDVLTAAPLVSLPGYKSVVQLKKGVRLTLWGNVPELWPAPPVFESLVELHHHDDLDADLTLRRGRIVLGNTRDRPARVRVRFENPTNPDLKEMWDLTLEDRDTEVALERWGMFPSGEPFFKDPKDKARKGPRADLALIVLKGQILLKNDDLTVPMEAPPKRALMLWNSWSGANGPSKFPEVPAWTHTPLPYPKGMEDVMLRPRADFRRARDSLSTALSGKVDRVDVGLANALKSDDASERTLVIRSFGAIDDLDSLLDALSDETHHEVRQTAIGTLRYWIGCSRDNDYRLFASLKSRYKLGEVENILTLLHGFGPEAFSKRETYETLIDYLTNENLAIRELASLYLYQLVPAGQKIGYSPVADSRERARSQEVWLKLLKSGQIPPRPMGK